MNLKDDMVPYDQDTLFHVLGLYRSPGECGHAIPRSKSQILCGVNYAYDVEEHPRCKGYHRTKRNDTLRKLNVLLEKVALANLDQDDSTIKEEIDSDATLKELRLHQITLTKIHFQEFTELVVFHYEMACDRVLRARKHSLNYDYYHPCDRLVKPGQEGNIARQLVTFTEENVNSWAITDLQDPSIVYTSEGARVLNDSKPRAPFDKREELEFPAHSEPVNDFIGKVTDAMDRRTNIVMHTRSAWEAYCRSVIANLEHCGTSVNSAVDESQVEGDDSPAIQYKKYLRMLKKADWQRDLRIRKLRYAVIDKLSGEYEGES